MSKTQKWQIGGAIAAVAAIIGTLIYCLVDAKLELAEIRRASENALKSTEIENLKKETVLLKEKLSKAGETARRLETKIAASTAKSVGEPYDFASLKDELGKLVASLQPKKPEDPTTFSQGVVQQPFFRDVHFYPGGKQAEVVLSIANPSKEAIKLGDIKLYGASETHELAGGARFAIEGVELRAATKLVYVPDLADALPVSKIVIDPIGGSNRGFLVGVHALLGMSIKFVGNPRLDVNKGTVTWNIQMPVERDWTTHRQCMQLATVGAANDTVKEMQAGAFAKALRACELQVVQLRAEGKEAHIIRWWGPTGGQYYVRYMDVAHAAGRISGGCQKDGHYSFYDTTEKRQYISVAAVNISGDTFDIPIVVIPVTVTTNP